MAKNKNAQYGQFHTPLSLAQYVVELVNSYHNLTGQVLEPSYGTGNFLSVLKDYPVQIEAIEIDPVVNIKADNITIQHQDFLDFQPHKLYDFIIGNPPYIELCYSFYSKEQQKKIKKEYKGLTKGRLNLVHIFLFRCLQLLAPNGILAFLLPSAVLSSPVYSRLRRDLYEQGQLLQVVTNLNFPDVAIQVCLIIFQRQTTTNHPLIKPYFYINNDNYFIMSEAARFQERLTLLDYGFEVNIGEIVWNQKRDYLTDDSSYPYLIYSSNIGVDEIDVTPKRNRLPCIKEHPVRYTNCIVMPRTVGRTIRYAYIQNNSYLFENHVLVITHAEPEKLERFYHGLKTGYYDEWLLGFFNSSNLSKTELLALPL